MVFLPDRPRHPESMPAFNNAVTISNAASEVPFANSMTPTRVGHVRILIATTTTAAGFSGGQSTGAMCESFQRMKQGINKMKHYLIRLAAICLLAFSVSETVSARGVNTNGCARQFGQCAENCSYRLFHWRYIGSSFFNVVRFEACVEFCRVKLEICIADM